MNSCDCHLVPRTQDTKPVSGWTLWESHMPTLFSGLCNMTLPGYVILLNVGPIYLDSTHLCGFLSFTDHFFSLRMYHHCPSRCDAFALCTGHSQNPHFGILILDIISCPYTMPSSGVTHHLHLKSNAHRLKSAKHLRLDI